MRLYVRTGVLAIAAALLCAGNVHRLRHPKTPHGLEVLLAHPCSWQESFNQIGDDRQIVVTNSDPGKLEINYMPFDEAGLRKEFALIYGTRNERLAWFEGDRDISYGEAVKTISAMYESGFHPDIALMNANDEALLSGKMQSRGPCPYKS